MLSLDGVFWFRVEKNILFEEWSEILVIFMYYFYLGFFAIEDNFYLKRKIYIYEFKRNEF